MSLPQGTESEQDKLYVRIHVYMYICIYVYMSAPQGPIQRCVFSCWTEMGESEQDELCVCIFQGLSALLCIEIYHICTQPLFVFVCCVCMCV